MKLSEGIKVIKGSPGLIPECPLHTFPEFLVEMGCKVGAEIGVYKGGFTEQFCQAGLKMYAIDPWSVFEGQYRGQEDQERQDFLYRHSLHVLDKYIKTGQCEIIRKTSQDAVQLFNPGDLDFVYIDGDHSFAAVAHDVYEWSKIVRKRGVVSGHDYYAHSLTSRNKVHVKPVIDAYRSLVRRGGDWWIFGKTDEQLRTYNSRFLSWFWFKGWDG